MIAVATNFLPFIALGFLVLAFGLLAYVAVSDVRRRIIPNGAIVALFVLFFGYAFTTPIPPVIWQNLAVFGVVFIFTFFCFHQRWLGGGDAKLIPVAALWAGPAGVLPLLFVMTLGGVVVAIALVLWNARRERITKNWRQLKLPYGVAISGAAILVLAVTEMKPLVDLLNGVDF